MRCGKRLVKIDVHHIDAEIRGPDFADQRVEIRPVTIEISTRVMKQF
jgi:hypothetical protein